MLILWGNRISRFKRPSLSPTVWSALKTFGVSGSIVAVITGYAAVAWTMIQAQPLSVVLSIALAAAGGILALYVIVRVYIRTLWEWPNFSEWRKVDPLRIWDIAHLWVNIEPPDLSEGPPRKRAYPTFRRLKTDAGMGKLKIEKKSGDQKNWLVKQSDLIEYAESCNERPLFLFPNPQASQSLPSPTHDPQRPPP